MSFTRRAFTPERMDDPEIPRDELAEALAFIRLVNARLGGTSAALRWIERWTFGPGRGSPRRLRVIDLGTGSADIPLAMVRWGRQRGVAVEVVAVDSHPTVVALAREWIAATAPGAQEIELVEGDALRLLDRYEPGSFDIAHAGMFLHHLPDIEVVTALRIMQRLTRVGVIWNDLSRSLLARIAVRTLVLGRPAAVRHDAIVSVAKGFTRTEALALAERAGLERVRYRGHLAGRFTLVEEPAREWRPR